MPTSPDPLPAEKEEDAALATRSSIRLMVLAMAAFTLNDALVKLASESMPTGQLIFLRGVLATTFVLMALRWMGATVQPRRLASGWVAARAVTDALATLLFLLSLFHLPLATATAIHMVTPLVIAALAAAWLGERVSPRRWIVIAVGFAGVLLVIQPGVDAFNGWAWLCLASTVVTALRDLITRRVPPDVSSITVTLATSMAVTLMALVVMLFEGWKPIALREGLLLAGAAAFLALGYQFIIRSTRSGDISAVAPFRYVGLLMAVALGWAVWGFVPNAMAWAGIALVIGAGLVLLRQGAR